QSHGTFMLESTCPGVDGRCEQTEDACPSGAGHGRVSRARCLPTRCSVQELGESVSYLKFTGAGSTQSVFEGVDKDGVGGYELGKQLRFENDLLFVILCVCDLMNVEAGQGIGLGVGLSGTMGEREVETGKIEGPPGLSSTKVLCRAPVFQVGMIGDDLERFG
ncbi:hypothetical protein BST65_00325, partial [Bradyrhizobium canariense]